MAKKGMSRPELDNKHGSASMCRTEASVGHEQEKSNSTHESKKESHKHDSNR